MRRQAAVALAAVAAASAQAAPAATAAGDAARGARIAASRSEGLCVLCHAWPGVPVHGSGDLGPDLSGVGARWDADALRARLLAPQRFNPATVMPAYGPPPPVADAARRVSAARATQPLLDAQQIEDVVAWLVTLR